MLVSSQHRATRAWRGGSMILIMINSFPSTSIHFQRRSCDVTAQEILPQVESYGPVSLLPLPSKSTERSFWCRSQSSCQGTSSLTRTNLVSRVATPRKWPLSLAPVEAVRNLGIMIDDEPTSSDHVASVSPVRDQAVPNQECHPSAFYGCANVCGYAASDGPECSGVSGSVTPLVIELHWLPVAVVSSSHLSWPIEYYLDPLYSSNDASQVPQNVIKVIKSFIDLNLWTQFCIQVGFSTKEIHPLTSGLWYLHSYLLHSAITMWRECSQSTVPTSNT